MTATVAYGTATNPQAGGTVASTGTLAAGRYGVAVTTNLGGTVTTVDANNMQLMCGGTVGTLMVNPTINTYQANADIEVDVPATLLAVTAVANASSSSAIYRAQIVATPLWEGENQ